MQINTRTGRKAPGLYRAGVRGPLYAVALLSALLVPVLVVGQASAQQVSNSFGGFATDSNAPIAIEADRLDVNDAAMTATFSGNVRASQGEFTIRSKQLVVHYVGRNKSGGASSAGSGASSGGGGGQDIRRIQALGKVLLSNGENASATGNEADFDVARQIITLSGDVVLSQSENVLKGKTLVIDLTTGQSQLKGGRISGLFSRVKRPSANENQ